MTKPPKERKKPLHTEGLGHREIGRILGISRTRVHQIEQEAFKKLLHPKNKKILQTFLQD